MSNKEELEFEIPQDLYDRVVEAASEMGLTFEEFFEQAIQEMIEQHKDKENITDEQNPGDSGEGD